MGFLNVYRHHPSQLVHVDFVVLEDDLGPHPKLSRKKAYKNVLYIIR